MVHFGCYLEFIRVHLLQISIQKKLEEEEYSTANYQCPVCHRFENLFLPMTAPFTSGDLLGNRIQIADLDSLPNIPKRKYELMSIGLRNAFNEMKNVLNFGMQHSVRIIGMSDFKDQISFLFANSIRQLQFAGKPLCASHNSNIQRSV